MAIDKQLSSHAGSGGDLKRDAAAIHQQMERILCSPELTATKAQRAFLRYVVEKTLSGRSEEIKGYSVATEVFGRKDDFDQATDPIVSIQANKLRRALERYYLVAGQNDPIRIAIPKGTYVPEFSGRADAGQAGISEATGSAGALFPNNWPTIVVESFENLTGARELDYFGDGLATEIALEITRYQEIRVLRQRPEVERRRATDAGARFILSGSVKKDLNGLKVIVDLFDAVSDTLIWGDAYRMDLDPAGMIDFEERIAATVVGQISGEYGVITKVLSLESRRIPPKELKTHQAMLRYYQFNLYFSQETFFDAYDALRQASRNEPECGLVWSMLARLYAANYSLELFNLDTPLEQAVVFAEEGVRLDPANQRVRTVMAFVLLFKNELAAGLAETEQALKLNPNSLIFIENIGYLMTLFGDWNRGPQIIKEAITLNPYYNTTVHHVLWLDWVRQGHYDRAYEESMHFARPTLFWDPLLKAAILGLLGRSEESVQAGKDLLACKPDFVERGRALIGNYVKCADLEDKIIEGLGCAGIDIS